MTNSIRNLACLAIATLVAFAPASAATVNGGQVDTTSTTLSTAVAAITNQNGAYPQQFCLTSATGVVLPSLAGNTSGSILMVDKEAAQVEAQGSSSTCFLVKRGVLGTQALGGHAALATVWVGAAAVSTGDNSRPFNGAFVSYPPVGPCVASAQYTLPVIVAGDSPATLLITGEPMYCKGGYWVRGAGQNYFPVPFSAFTTLSPPNPIATTSVTDINGKIWASQIGVPYNATATGACVLNGATVGTDKWMFILYDGAGNVIANTAVAGVTTATASKYQCIAFVAPVSVQGPSTYFVAVQGNGTTDNFQSYATASAPTNYGTVAQTGTFGTAAALTAPTKTFTAATGPLMMLY